MRDDENALALLDKIIEMGYDQSDIEEVFEHRDQLNSIEYIGKKTMFGGIDWCRYVDYNTSYKDMVFKFNKIVEEHNTYRLEATIKNEFKVETLEHKFMPVVLTIYRLLEKLNSEIYDKYKEGEFIHIDEVRFYIEGYSKLCSVQ